MRRANGKPAKKSVVLRDTRWPTWSCFSFQQRFKTLAILFFGFLPWGIAGLFFLGHRISWLAGAAMFAGKFLWSSWILFFLPTHFFQGVMLVRANRREPKEVVFWWAASVTATFGTVVVIYHMFLGFMWWDLF